MRLRKLAGMTAAAAAVVLVAACQSPQAPDVLSSKPAVELRAMQTRAFDTTDRNKVLRAVIATLQDLGYMMEQVEPSAGTVSATKLGVLRLTVTVYPRGTTQMTVRANAMVQMAAQNTQVDDPLFYQQRFFEPFSKAMFLSALQVDDTDDGPAAGTEITDPTAGSASGTSATAEPTSTNTLTQGN